MGFLSRLKIGTRLILGFALIILLFAGTITVALFNYNKSISLNRTLLDDYISNYQMIEEVNVTAGLLFLSYRNYYLEYPDQEKMQVRLNDIDERLNTIISTLEDYRSIIEQRSDNGDTYLVEQTLATVKNEVTLFTNKLIETMEAEKLDEVHQMIVSKELRDLRSAVQGNISQIFSNSVQAAIDLSEKDINSASLIIVALVSAMAIITLFAAFFSAMLINSIKKPVNRVVGNSEKAASGDFSIEWQANRTDEIGGIARANKKVTDTFKMLIDDINGMINRYFDGEVNIKIDITKYQGEYSRLAENVNRLYAAQTIATNDILKCLHSFADGDFSADISQFKGEQQAINKTVDSVRDIFIELRREIQKLINSSLEGNLTASADSAIFNGEWKVIVEGLNKLLTTIMAPFNEAMSVVTKMSDGDFTGRVNGDYRGTFREIKDMVNNMVDVVGSYIDELSNVLTTMSSKNLDVEIKREYVGKFTSLKDSTNLIVDTFNTILADIMSSAEYIALGAKQIAEGNQFLANGVTEQTVSVTEMRDTLSGIESQAHSTVRSTKEANRLSNEAVEAAKQGNTSMKDMLSAMQQINESSNNISKVIKTIDDIAMQTNLLALNASVEAARAGEHGKGFSIVAENVRSLAAKSQEAAKNTAVLLSGSKEAVDRGTKIANVTADLLTHVVEKVEYVSDILEQIESASIQQSDSIDEVNSNISDISSVTLSNSSTCQEQAAASEELSSQTDLFRDTAKGFNIKKKINSY